MDNLYELLTNMYENVHDKKKFDEHHKDYLKQFEDLSETLHPKVKEAYESAYNHLKDVVENNKGLSAEDFKKLLEPGYKIINETLPRLIEDYKDYKPAK